MNRNKQIWLYGITGLLIGIILTWIIASAAVNNNNQTMMGMMGLNRSKQANSNIDRHFIEQMIPHHEGAIAMAKVAQQNAAHSEIKTLSDKIITSQTEEINKMRQWYKQWFGEEVPKRSITHMIHGGMMGDESDISDLTASSDFDMTFLRLMIIHHQTGVMMANMLQNGTNRSEMKQLAQGIIISQSNEINDMRQWQIDWAND